MINAALKYAEKFPVFPCGRDKKPLVKNGFKSATRDPQQIREWWEKWPDASIGAPTGPASGFWVLDVDLPEGPGTLRALEDQHCNLPRTMTQRTGGGGQQYFFRYNGDIIRNSASKIGPGLDVRGEGGYIILPPSGHPSGGAYAWLRETAPADAPTWLVAKAKDKPKNDQPKKAPTSIEHSTAYGLKALEEETAKVRATDEGVRNDTLNTVAFSLGQLVAGGELTESLVGQSLLDSALAAGLPQSEAEKTISSGLRAGMLEPRTATKDKQSNTAEIYTPPTQISHEDFILTSSQFIELSIPDKRIFLNPWLCENSISLISGWRGCGKTWFALSILDAVSTGQSFGLWTADEPVPCLFCDGEMPIQDVRERVKYLGINSDNLIIYCDALMNHNRLSRAHLGNPEWRAMMKDILINKKIKLWVVDNLASLASGLDENSKQEWDPINQWFLELRFAGIATAMLHHMNKTGGQRGTSGREDNLDISIILEKPSDYTPEDGARFVANFTKARISNKDLAFISPTEFKLVEDIPGTYTWNFNNVKKETNRAVLQMISDGADNKAICDTLSLSKGYVSKVKKRLLEDGHISTKGEVTQRGFQVIHGL